MKIKLVKLFIISCLLCATMSAYAKPRTPINLWHAMGGDLGEVMNQLADTFNQSQPDYQLNPVYKGSYNEVLTSTVAAFRAGKAPHLVQIFEVGTATMVHPEGVTVPISQLLTDFDSQLILPAIRHYYSDNKGQLLAMPFNSSSAVMFYNKDAFIKAGLDPEKPPKTFPDLAKVAQTLLKAGYSCGFTTTYPSWIQVESFSAWHNAPLATDANGFDNLSAKTQFNNKILTQHVKQLTQWQQQRIFQYGGRDDNASALFTSGHCPMLMQSSGALMSFQKNMSFTVGVAPLPYWPDILGAPQNTVIGGAALWAMTGHSELEYAGIAAFLKFLLQVDTQVNWQKVTGYLPITIASLNYSKANGYFQRHPGAYVAINTLNNKPPTEFSGGLRLGNFMQIRDMVDESLELVWSGKKTVEEVFPELERRANQLLHRFERNIKKES